MTSDLRMAPEFTNSLMWIMNSMANLTLIVKSKYSGKLVILPEEYLKAASYPVLVQAEWIDELYLSGTSVFRKMVKINTNLFISAISTNMELKAVSILRKYRCM